MVHVIYIYIATLEICIKCCKTIDILSRLCYNEYIKLNKENKNMKIKVKYINTNNRYYRDITSLDQAIEIIRIQEVIIANYRINSIK